MLCAAHLPCVAISCRIPRPAPRLESQALQFLVGGLWQAIPARFLALSHRPVSARLIASRPRLVGQMYDAMQMCVMAMFAVCARMLTTPAWLGVLSGHIAFEKRGRRVWGAPHLTERSVDCRLHPCRCAAANSTQCMASPPRSEATALTLAASVGTCSRRTRRRSSSPSPTLRSSARAQAVWHRVCLTSQRFPHVPSACSAPPALTPHLVIVADVHAQEQGSDSADFRPIFATHLRALRTSCEASGSHGANSATEVGERRPLDMYMGL